MDFTKGNFEANKSANSILQALSCQFFGCNLLVFCVPSFQFLFESRVFIEN